MQKPGRGCLRQGAACELHLAELEVALDVRQRLDDRREHEREQRRLDQPGNHRCSSLGPELARSRGSTSSGAKYRNLPWLRCRSAAGSSGTLTARCTAPSTSNSTASTTASRPARNRSWASARRAPGRIRTLLPRAMRTPAMSTWSVSGDTEAS